MASRDGHGGYTSLCILYGIYANITAWYQTHTGFYVQKLLQPSGPVVELIVLTALQLNIVF